MWCVYMCGCQNYGPFLGTLNIRGRIIIGNQKGTMILTTTHMYICIYIYTYIWSGLMERQLEREDGTLNGDRGVTVMEVL